MKPVAGSGAGVGALKTSSPLVGAGAQRPRSCGAPEFNSQGRGGICLCGTSATRHQWYPTPGVLVCVCPSVMAPPQPLALMVKWHPCSLAVDDMRKFEPGDVHPTPMHRPPPGACAVLRAGLEEKQVDLPFEALEPKNGGKAIDSLLI